jgi:membrane protein
MNARIHKEAGSMNYRSLFRLSKAAIASWQSDFAPSMGAALAYYTVFSIAPLLVIVIAVAAVVFGQDAAHAAIMEQARGTLGENAANAIDSMLSSAQKPGQGMLATVLGIVTMVVGATTVFAELESNLNRIWKVEPDKGAGLWHFLRTRLLSFGMVLAIGFLLITSLAVSAAIAVWARYWRFGAMQAVLHAANFLVTVGIIAVLFALIYRFMPRVRLAWRDVWMGALITSVLFSLGKILIELYISNSGVVSSYGAAGAPVVLLLWVYYSAQIFLLGAEFTKVYAESHGSRQGQPATVDAAATSTRKKSHSGPGDASERVPTV